MYYLVKETAYNRYVDEDNRDSIVEYETFGYSESFEVAMKNAIEMNSTSHEGHFAVLEESVIEDEITGNEKELNDLPFGILYEHIVYVHYNFKTDSFSADRAYSEGDVGHPVKDCGQKKYALNYYDDHGTFQYTVCTKDPVIESIFESIKKDLFEKSRKWVDLL